MDNKETNVYTCKDCGNTFELTVSEERFFTDKGLYIPKRCLNCRQKRREEKDRAMMN